MSQLPGPHRIRGEMSNTDKDNFFVVAKLLRGSGKLSIIDGSNTVRGQSQLMSLKDANDLAADIHESLNMETLVCQLYCPEESETP